MASSSFLPPFLQMPTDNNFDQDTAKLLLTQCGTLIVENFPSGSEFGIDLSIHYTGDKFFGIKLIPPGLHFVYFSLVSKQDSTVAPRSGFFHYFNAGDVLITKWDNQAEDLILFRNDTEQMDRLKCSFKSGNLDGQLGAYQFDQYQTWVSLTDFISNDLFLKLNPTCGKIFSASALVYKPNADGSVTARLDQHGLPEMVVAPESAIHFFCEPIPRRFLYPDSATPKEITVHSLDSTFTLDSILAKPAYGNVEDNLLGELQFVFIAFLLGHVFDAFEYWRDMLRIICSARLALSTRPELYLSFIRVVHFQLKQTNEAIFADIVENENQVFQFMRTFMLNLRSAADNGVSLQLRQRGEKFVSALQKSMRWNFDDEPDDELPIICDLPTTSND